MKSMNKMKRGFVAEKIGNIGWCLELIPMDPNFHDITVGLYVKNNVYTLWTFSQKPGVANRIRQIRDQLNVLGGMEPLDCGENQSAYPCGQTHGRPTKFLAKQAVEKPVDFRLPTGPVKDLRSPLLLSLDVTQVEGKWVYAVRFDGDAPNPGARVRAVTRGLEKYGDMIKNEIGLVGFNCGYRHDQLARLTLPYARNVSAVEDELESESMRGQMTTGTLGFTPPT